MPSERRPASAVQRQMWMVDQLDPSASIYNEDVAFWIDGPFDATAFEAAWRQVSCRHRALRYVFDGSEDLQVAVSDHELPAMVSESAEDDDEAVQWATAFVENPYEPSESPSVRVGLVRVLHDRTLLVIGFHHLIIDVGSVSQVFEELSSAYAAHRDGEQPVFDDIEVDHFDFLSLAAEPKQQERAAEAVSHVVTKLRAVGSVSPAEIPGDRARPALKGNQGSLTKADFPPAVMATVREFAAEHRLTPFHVLLAAMSSALWRHSRNPAPIIGVGTAGRPPEFEEAVGPFACFVPALLDVGTTSTFASLCDHAKDIAFDLPVAQFAPFSEVVNQTVERRDPARSPLVQIVFNAPPLGFRSDTFADCTMTQARLPRSRARVDMLVNLEFHGDDVVATSEFDDAIFDESTVEAFLSHIGALTAAGIAGPDVPLDELSFADPAVVGTIPLDDSLDPTAEDVEGSDGHAARIEDGIVIAATGQVAVLEDSGSPVAAGVAGRLVIDGEPVADVRSRCLVDGTVTARSTRRSAAATEEATQSGLLIEGHLVELCQELLESPQVGATDDFFAAGGHSMVASRLIQTLNLEFDTDIPLLVVFEHPVLSDMAREVNAHAPKVENILRRLGDLSADEIAELSASVDDTAAADLDVSAVVKLSAHEQPFWLMEQFAPGSAVNTLTLSLVGRGKVDTAALEQALNAVVERHDILRTGYRSSSSAEARRVVADQASLSIDVVQADLEGATERRNSEAERGFSIDDPPLLRWTCVFTGDDSFELVLSYHHLVMDYWGVTRVMLPEISRLYAEFMGVEKAELGDAPRQYRAAVARLDEWQGSAPQRREADYWKGQLAGLEPTVFPHDQARDDSDDFAGATVTAVANADLTSKLATVIAERRTTAFAMIAAAVAGVMHNWTNAADISFMTPAENRRHDDDVHTMGTFVNLVMLRFDFTELSTWADVLDRTRKVSAEAYAHQSTPLNEALGSVEQDNLVSDGQGRYLVLNVFRPEAGLQLDGAEIESVSIVPHPNASTDLELSVMDGESLSFSMKYRDALWDRSTIVGLVDDILEALSALTSSPDTEVVSASGHQTRSDG